MRILFLGNDFNPFSVGCLSGLASAGKGDLLVGIHSPAGGGLLDTVRRSYAQFGAGFVARRARDLTLARLGLWLRAHGRTPRRVRSLREACLLYGIDSFACGRVNDGATLDRIRGFEPWLIVMAAFSQILRAPVLEIPRLGAINVHPSLLPKYRGPNPFYWVLAQNEERSGVTVHHASEGIDAGDIIGQREVPILEGDRERDLLRRSTPVAARLLADAVAAIGAGEATRTPQHEAEASYYSHPPRGRSTL